MVSILREIGEVGMRDIIPYESMITGSFLTNCQIEKLKDSFKDLVVVIRCKDCKYGALMSDAITYMCESPEQENKRCVHEHNGYWFCADGERR